MRALFYAHSGLRYLVLLAAVLAIAWYLFGWLTKRPTDRSTRVVGAIFVGLLDLQVLLGVSLVIGGTYYPRLIGHIVMMLLAAVVVHVALVVNRRKTQPTWSLPLIGIAAGLALVIGGVLAIARPIFGTTPI